MIVGLAPGRGGSEVTPAGGKLGGLVPVAEQAVVTHSTETTGQHVQQETSKEISRGQPEDLLLTPACVVTPAQVNDSVAKTE